MAATRSGRWFLQGLSPRAGIAVLRAAKARGAAGQPRLRRAPDDMRGGAAADHRPSADAGRRRRARRGRAGAGDDRGGAAAVIDAAAPARPRMAWIAHPLASLRARIDGWFLSRRRPSDTHRADPAQRLHRAEPSAGWMLGGDPAAAPGGLHQLPAQPGLPADLPAGRQRGRSACTCAMAPCAGLAHAPSVAGRRNMPARPPCSGWCCRTTRRSTRYGIGHGGASAAASGPGAMCRRRAASTVEVAFHAGAARACIRCRPLTAETRFPLGTFRVWTVWRPASRMLVYPAPEAESAAACRRAEPLSKARVLSRPPPAAQLGAGEYDGVRPYRRGDPLKLVVWKKAAQRAGRSARANWSAAMRNRPRRHVKNSGWTPGRRAWRRHRSHASRACAPGC